MKKASMFVYGLLMIAAFSCIKKEYFFAPNRTDQYIKIFPGGWYTVDDGSLYNPDKDSVGPFDVIKVHNISKNGIPYIDITYFETNFIVRPESICDIDTASLIKKEQFFESMYTIQIDQNINSISVCN